MASTVYNKFAAEIMNGGIAPLTDTLKFILLKSSYSPAKTHNFVSDVSAHEADVSGETWGFSGTGRKTLASKAVTENDSNNRGELDCADVTWSSLATGNNIQYVACYKQGTSDADSKLLGVFDNGSAIPTNGGNLTYQVAANGFININT